MLLSILLPTSSALASGRDVAEPLGIPGVEIGDGFGASTASGDFDGDGRADLLAGAPGAADGAGLAYLYPDAATWAGGTPEGLPAPAGRAFGSRMAAGDLNRDGFDDAVVVSAAAGDGEMVWRYVSVSYGGCSGLGAIATVIDGGGLDGDGVVEADGDADGDGYPDVLLSNEDNAIAVLLGSAGGISQINFSVRSGSYLSSIAYAGDVNGDGYDDVVGTDNWGHGGEYSGPHLAVFFGPLVPEQEDDQFLQALLDESLTPQVASAGDLDGDGYDDVALGGPGDLCGSFRYSGAFIIGFGSADGLVPGTVVCVGEIGFAASFAAPGDIDGDGFDDLVTGDVFDTYVYWGGAEGVIDEDRLTLPRGEGGEGGSDLDGLTTLAAAGVGQGIAVGRSSSTELGSVSLYATVATPQRDTGCQEDTASPDDSDSGADSMADSSRDSDQGSDDTAAGRKSPGCGCQTGAPSPSALAGILAWVGLRGTGRRSRREVQWPGT